MHVLQHAVVALSFVKLTKENSLRAFLYINFINLSLCLRCDRVSCAFNDFCLMDPPLHVHCARRLHSCSSAAGSAVLHFVELKTNLRESSGYVLLHTIHQTKLVFTVRHRVFSASMTVS